MWDSSNLNKRSSISWGWEMKAHDSTCCLSRCLACQMSILITWSVICVFGSRGWSLMSQRFTSYFSSSNANMVMQSTNVVKMIGNSWSYCPALLWVPLRAIFRWGETVKEWDETYSATKNLTTPPPKNEKEGRKKGGREEGKKGREEGKKKGRKGGVREGGREGRRKDGRKEGRNEGRQ